jgi:hypothetical protein
MGDPVKGNIIKTHATMWFAPEGETVPDETSVAAGADWGGNWAKLGFTSAPLSMTYDDKRMQVKVEEILADAIDEWRTEESGMLETELAELIADYLSLMTDNTPQTTAAAAGQGGFEDMSIGGNARVSVHAFGFEGIRYDENDNALPIRFFAPRATFKVNGKMEWSQKTDSYVKLPLQIKALGDPDSSGRLFRMYRVTAPATS